VTPAGLITGIITERGIIGAKREEDIESLQSAVCSRQDIVGNLQSAVVRLKFVHCTWYIVHGTLYIVRGERQYLNIQTMNRKILFSILIAAMSLGGICNAGVTNKGETGEKQVKEKSKDKSDDKDKKGRQGQKD